MLKHGKTTSYMTNARAAVCPVALVSDLHTLRHSHTATTSTAAKKTQTDIFKRSITAAVADAGYVYH